MAAGRLGRKSGQGFYRYDHDGGALGPAVDVLEPASVPQGAADVAPPAPMTPGEIADRVVLAIIIEACRALEEQVALQADIDLALCLGAGHPRGPFEQVDRFGGPAGVVARLDRFVSQGHARFEPVVLLRERAAAP